MVVALGVSSPTMTDNLEFEIFVTLAASQCQALAQLGAHNKCLYLAPTSSPMQSYTGFIPNAQKTSATVEMETSTSTPDKTRHLVLQSRVPATPVEQEPCERGMILLPICKTPDTVAKLHVDEVHTSPLCDGIRLTPCVSSPAHSPAREYVLLCLLCSSVDSIRVKLVLCCCI